MITNNQYLTFNPKKQLRNEKQRQGIQLRFRPQQPVGQPTSHQPHFHPHYPKVQSALDQKINLQSFNASSTDQFKESNYSVELRDDLSSEESIRKKEDIIKRVKNLQNIVLPLVERGEEEEEKSDVGWQSKVDRKMLKIESGLDSIRK